MPFPSSKFMLHNSKDCAWFSLTFYLLCLAQCLEHYLKCVKQTNKQTIKYINCQIPLVILFAFLWVFQPTTLLLRTMQIQTCIMLLPLATILLCQVFMKLSLVFTRPIRQKLHKTTLMNLFCHLTLLDSWQNHNELKEEDLALI